MNQATAKIETINTESATAEPGADIVQRIAIGQLKPDPDQPRKFFDPKALKELASDIKVRDIIEPIIFRTDEKGKQFIVAGERRWRAAKIAGMKTVPCLLRNSSDPVERLFDQVSENFQREGLTPIEMASFFDVLNTKHGIKVKDIGSFIQQHGLRKFERSYISNIRRLLQLPEWAQKMIHTGEITAAHGKHLLEGLGSDLVMNDLKAFLKKPSNFQHEPLTSEDITYQIQEGFEQHHITLSTTWGNDATLFDFETSCKGCSDCKAFGSYRKYCMNKECFDKKQAEALKKKEAAEKAAATRAKNKLKKQAEKMGTTVEELELVNEAITTPLLDPRKAGRLERTQAYLDEWLREQLRSHLVEDEATRYMVVLWMATGSPGQHYACAEMVQLEHRQDDLFGKIDTDEQGIDTMLKQQCPAYDLEYAIFHTALNYMNRQDLRKLAHHCEIELEGNYVVDADYLNIKLKAEIIESTPQAVIDAFDDWAKTCKGPSSELVDRIVARDVQYSVPADLIAMYNSNDET